MKWSLFNTDPIDYAFLGKEVVWPYGTRGATATAYFFVAKHKSLLPKCAFAEAGKDQADQPLPDGHPSLPSKTEGGPDGLRHLLACKPRCAGLFVDQKCAEHGYGLDCGRGFHALMKLGLRKAQHRCLRGR